MPLADSRSAYKTSLLASIHSLVDALNSQGPAFLAALGAEYLTGDRPEAIAGMMEDLDNIRGILAKIEAKVEWLYKDTT